VCVCVCVCARTRVCVRWWRFEEDILSVTLRPLMGPFPRKYCKKEREKRGGKKGCRRGKRFGKYRKAVGKKNLPAYKSHPIRRRHVYCGA
jgi:hypothetical protein